MNYNSLTTPQLIYIIAVALIVALIIFLLLFIPLRRRSIKKKFVEHYYKEIYKIALNNDYYLINNFAFKVDDSSLLKINHILFGEKYVYLINDYHFDGDIAGKAFDKSLICFSKRGKKYYIDNPIVRSKYLLDRLTIMTGLDPTIMIGISLVNDDCSSDIISQSKQYYLVQRNKLASLVKAIESRNIGKLNEKSLEKLVHSINKMNRKKKKQ